LQQRYYDQAIGLQLANAILAFEEDGRYTIDASVFGNAFNPRDEGHVESLAALTAMPEMIFASFLLVAAERLLLIARRR